jgi:hypothetical protein
MKLHLKGYLGSVPEEKGLVALERLVLGGLQRSRSGTSLTGRERIKFAFF